MNRALKIILVSRIVILFFLIFIIAIFNIPSLIIEEQEHYSFYFDILSFINESFLIVIAIGGISIFSGIFWYLRFPYKNLAPITSAVITIFSVELLYRFYLFLDETFIGSGFEIPFIEYYVYVFAFALVLGYAKIFNIYIKVRRRRISRRKSRRRTEKPRYKEPSEVLSSTEEQSSEESSQETISTTPGEMKISTRKDSEKPSPEPSPESLEEKKVVEGFQGKIFLVIERIAGGLISFIDSFKASESR